MAIALYIFYLNIEKQARTVPVISGLKQNKGDSMQRPLDVLGSSQDKKVIIQLKSGGKITGTLRAFDSHINVWLDDAGTEDKDNSLKLGKVLVRGDNIVLISPEK